MRLRSTILLLLAIFCCAIIPLRAQQPKTKGLTNAGTSSVSPLTAGVEISPTARNKIAPALLKQFLEAGRRGESATRGQMRPAPGGLQTKKGAPVTYLVFLRDRADLRGLNAIANKHARRAALVDRLQNTARGSQAELLDYLEERASQGNVLRYKSYWAFNGLVVEGDLETALELAKRPKVEAIRPNRLHHLPAPRTDPNIALDSDDPAWNVTKIQADRVWRAFGITGKGVVVANMDSGVDWTHPALQHKYRGYNAENPSASVHDYNWFDPTGTYPQAPGPNSPHISQYSDHGTHTMGTLVGSEQDGSHAIGVAPGAQWIALKIFDNDGIATDEWIHAGFQWCLAPTDLQGQNPDPSKAPDIVSNSWGDANSLDETFRQDVEALRAAGILSTWSAGNEGPSAGSIDSPAGLDAAFAVGAVDENDQVASFSSRGPSPWVQIKPDVVAPGVGILSCIPGGTYEGGWSGTSMATPHAAGLAALMWEAAPDSRSITSTEQTIISTTVDLGVAGPDTSYGYGRLDAYQAVGTVMQAGAFAGRITEKGTDLPIEGATVSMHNLETGGQASTTSGADGFYSFAVAEGSYDVTVTKFGYTQSLARDIEIRAQTTTQLDFALESLPTGILSGHVTAAEEGEAVPATIEVLNTPLETSTDANGDYALEAPVGTYTVRVMSQETGYRGIEQQAEIEEGRTTTVNFSLSSAPHLLLVDADAWSTEPSIIGYYEQDLHHLLYAYDLWAIENNETDVPSASKLAQYDVVIWAQPQTSPGYIDAWESLGTYLSGGGNLLISGQDIGYWDQNASRAPEAYRQYTGARYLQDDSGLAPLSGTPGTILEDHELIYNTDDSAGNQETPDAIAPAGAWAEGIIRNEQDTTVGLRNDTCTYRVIYLTFGLEGVGPADARRGVLNAAIEELSATRSTRDVRISISPPHNETTPGSRVSRDLFILNQGTTADTYELSAQSSTWSTTIVDPATGQTVEDTGLLQPCEIAEFTIQIAVPPWAAANDYNTTAVRVTSTVSSEVARTQSIKTTALREWRDAPDLPTPRYRLAAAATDCALYAIGGYDADGNATDTVEILDLASNTWETGAGKPTPLANAAAVESGGLLYVTGGYNSDTAQRYSDVVEIYDPRNDTWRTGPSLPKPLSGMAATALQGKVYVLGGNDGDGAVNDAYVYDPAVDNWTAIASLPTAVSFAQATSLNGHIYLAGGWPDRRDLFRYDPSTESWQTLAPMAVGRQSFAMASDGRYIYVAGGGEEWTALNSAARYDPVTDQWLDLLPLNLGARAGSAGAYVGGHLYVVGGSDTTVTGAIERMDLDSPLTGSYFSMDPTIAKPGEIVNCSLVLRNRSTQDISADWTHPLPTALQYVEGSATGGASYDAGENSLHWSGIVSQNALQTFTFQAEVASAIASGTTLMGTVYVDTGGCASKKLTASTQAFIPSLSTSQKMVDRDQTVPGDTLHYTIQLANTAPLTVTSGSLLDPLPEHTTYVSESVTGAWYNETQDRIEWSGSVPPARQLAAEFSWIDASGGQHLELGDDDCIGPLDLGFNFTFYENTYSEIYVNSNGMLLFESCDTSYSNAAIPNSEPPGNFVAPFWDDLRPDVSGGAVYFSTFGQEPNRYAVVQWDDVNMYGEEPPQTFQVILYEGSNSVVFQYLDMTGQRGTGSEATVGLENKGGTKGVQYLYNGSPSAHALSDRLAVEVEHDGTSKASIHTVSFDVRVDSAAPPLVIIRNTALIEDGWGSYERTVTSTVRSPDLTASAKTAQPSSVLSGEIVTYTLELLNSGSVTATNTVLLDPLPQELDYIHGSLEPADATYNQELRQIEWQGTVPLNSAGVEISYQTRVVEGLPVNTQIQNEATLSIQDVEMASMPCQVLANEVDLGPSQKTASAAELTAGSPLTYTITLRNAGRHTAEHTLMTDTLPPGLELIEGTLEGGTYGAEERSVYWSGPLATTEEHTVSFGATALPTVTNGTQLNNVAEIDDGYGNRLERTAPLTIWRSDLSDSTMAVSRERTAAGATVTYTVNVYNTGAREAKSTLTCAPPDPLLLVSGSAYSTAGSTQMEDGALTWQGTIDPHSLIVVRFGATIPSDTEPQVIVNEARLSDGGGLEYLLQASLTVEGGYTIVMPLLYK